MVGLAKFIGNAHHDPRGDDGMVEIATSNASQQAAGRGAGAALKEDPNHSATDGTSLDMFEDRKPGTLGGGRFLSAGGANIDGARRDDNYNSGAATQNSGSFDSSAPDLQSIRRSRVESESDTSPGAATDLTRASLATAFTAPIEHAKCSWIPPESVFSVYRFGGEVGPAAERLAKALFVDPIRALRDQYVAQN